MPTRVPEGKFRERPLLFVVVAARRWRHHRAMTPMTKIGIGIEGWLKEHAGLGA